MNPVLAIDQGTTNTKALLFGPDGAVLASASCPVALAHPRPGWAEQSPAELWQSAQSAAMACLAEHGAAGGVTIAVTNQRESVLLWDRATGEPVGPCVSWQCRRSADRIDALRRPEVERLVAERTGLGLDPLFPAAKLGWLLDELPGARTRAERGALCAGTVDSWLLFKLTGGAVHATDHGNASRTQLLDIHRLCWDEELLDLFGIPARLLPDLRPSDACYGATAVASGLPPGLPVHAVVADSHAALYGHGARGPGPVKATFGTGSSLLTLTDGPRMSAHGLSQTVAWTAGGRTEYALEGNITVSGQAASFVAGMLGLLGAEALAELARSVPDSGGVVFVPALAGLGAPHWDDRARGLVAGLTLASTPAHLARATLEAIAHQVADVLDALDEDVGRPAAMLRVDGGASGSDTLMQLVAGLTGREVERGSVAELSAFGAACMAGVASGAWDEAALLPLCRAWTGRITPAMAEDVRDRLREAWHGAVSLARQGSARSPTRPRCPAGPVDAALAEAAYSQ